MPALEEAQTALKSLKKEDITQVKTFTNPHAAVEMTLRAVLILLGYDKQDWATAKSAMQDMKFLDRLKGYDVDNIPESILKKLRPIVTSDTFDVVQIGKIASAA